jgi:hypothetical protein
MDRILGRKIEVQEKVPERTLLGGALSFEFSDCSVAAADLS